MIVAWLLFVYQVWMFSSACEPITTWRINEHAHLSEHLKHCPYNVKLERTHPVAVSLNSKCALAIL